MSRFRSVSPPLRDSNVRISDYSGFVKRFFYGKCSNRYFRQIIPEVP